MRVYWGQLPVTSYQLPGIYMQLKHYSEEKLKEQLRGIVSKRLGSDVKMFFFGSRVNGTAGDRSDIDFGIDAGRPIDEKTLLEIREAVENIPVLYTIDVVDFSRVSSIFREVAMKQYKQI